MSQLKKYIDRKGHSLPHLYQDVNTLEFWVVLRVGKKVRRRNLKTTDYPKALAKMPIALADLGDTSTETVKRADAARDVKLIKDYWAEYHQAKINEEVSPATLTRMDVVWRLHLEPFFGVWRADEVQPTTLKNFLAWHKRNFPDAQLVNVYKYLGALLNYMVRVGALLPKQLPELNLPKSEQKHHATKKGRIITDDERRALLSSGNERIRLVCALADVLGNRKMEVVGLQKDRIKRDGGRMFFELTAFDTKTGLARVLPIPKHLEPLVEAQVVRSGESRFLFPTKSGESHMASQVIDKDWRAMKREAGIKGRLRFHDWRHTRATKFAKANVNPVLACTILGMTIGQYQKTYLQLTGRDLLSTVDAVVASEVVS